MAYLSSRQIKALKERNYKLYREGRLSGERRRILDLKYKKSPQGKTEWRPWLMDGTYK